MVALHSRIGAAKRARRTQAVMARVSEAQIHKSVADYLDAALPRSCFWTTFPAGGGGKVRGAQLKRRGLRAGVPDIMLIWQGQAWFIELKGPKGKLSPDQVATKGDIEDAGARVGLCRNVEEVERFLKHYVCVAPLRASVAA